MTVIPAFVQTVFCVKPLSHEGLLPVNHWGVFAVELTVLICSVASSSDDNTG